MKRLVAGFVGVGLSACGAATTLEAENSAPQATPLTALAARRHITNPVIHEDFADPAVLKVKNGYYAYATNGAGKNVKTSFSTDLLHWEEMIDALPHLPHWAEKGLTWAPDVSALGDDKGYVLYFTARAKDAGVQCVGVATSQHPAGPFATDATEPLICPVGEGGAIDAAGFKDADGQRYVVWKNDGNSRGLTTKIHLQKVDATGTRLEGPAVALIKNDLDWEGPVVEAPVIHRHAHLYYLFYSANRYNTPAYSVGYATAERVEGPYTKQGRILASSNVHGPVIGPGGQYIFTDADDKLYMAYHSWTTNMSIRPLSLAALTWPSGKPAVLPTWGIKAVH